MPELSIQSLNKKSRQTAGQARKVRKARKARKAIKSFEISEASSSDPINVLDFRCHDMPADEGCGPGKVQFVDVRSNKNPIFKDELMRAAMICQAERSDYLFVDAASYLPWKMVPSPAFQTVQNHTFLFALTAHLALPLTLLVRCASSPREQVKTSVSAKEREREW